MDNCVPKAQSLLREVSLSPEIAFNTPAIFFLEFLILGMMYTQLAGDVTWRESLLFPHTKLSYLGEHSEASQAR